MDGERPCSRNIGNLQCAPQGVEKQPRTDAAALPCAMHGQTCEDEKRYRKARHSLGDALRRVGVFNFAHDERIEADHGLVVDADIGLRRSRLLRLEGMTNEKTIKLRLTAGKFFDRVCALQLFDP